MLHHVSFRDTVLHKYKTCGITLVVKAVQNLSEIFSFGQLDCLLKGNEEAPVLSLTRSDISLLTCLLVETFKTTRNKTYNRTIQTSRKRAKISIVIFFLMLLL